MLLAGEWLAGEPVRSPITEILEMTSQPLKLAAFNSPVNKSLSLSTIIGRTVEATVQLIEG